MSKIMLLLVAILSLTACENIQNRAVFEDIPAKVLATDTENFSESGAVAGGLIGYALFDNSALGAVGGAIAGGNAFAEGCRVKYGVDGKTIWITSPSSDCRLEPGTTRLVRKFHHQRVYEDGRVETWTVTYRRLDQ